MIDYHVHSRCSGDCSAAMADVCRAAVGAGLSEICFTEHVDFEPTDSCYRKFDYEVYKDRISQARGAFAGRLEVRAGVEVDFQEKYRSEIRDFLDGKRFDYVLGAAHYVDGIILEDYERYFAGRSEEEAYAPYFECVLAAVETGWFDALAHLDLCKRYGVRYFGPFEWERYRGRIDAILRAVTARGMTLEINTSGLRQWPEDTYPGREIVRRYYALGGRNITVGSDAHRVQDVGSGTARALRMARGVGFERVDIFRGRQRATAAIDELLNVCGRGMVVDSG